MKESLHKSSLRPKCDQDSGLDPDQTRYQFHIIWRNVIILILFHVVALIGLWKALTVAVWKTNLFWYSYGTISSLGVTAGVHRLWSHRSYNARLPLRIFLMLCYSAMFQNNIFEWVRDHKLHHTFTDTDADPHNSSRGFFFSHIGWLMVKKHKNVLEKGRNVDMSYVLADPVVRFQRKYFLLLSIPLCFVIPAHIPWYFFGESYLTSWCVTVLKYVLSLHYTWLVNSAAHMWGSKPYDMNINPTENKLVAFLANGEGWHNYHHVFPWDYKAAELGNYGLNLTTAFLDFMAFLGQAYDLKTAKGNLIAKRAKRSGDGSWIENPENSGKTRDNVPGWNDRDIEDDNIQNIQVFNNRSE